MSHQVQLSPAASHCLTAVMDPTGHAAEPPACRSRWPYSPGRTCARDCPTLKIRSARPSFTPPPKIPGRARDQYDGRTGPLGPATVRPLSAARPDSREEGSGARTPRATCPRRITCRAIRAAICQQGSGPRSTCELPRRYLPSTSSRPASPTGRRPAPTTTPAHPILPNRGRFVLHAYALIGMFTRNLESRPEAATIGNSASSIRIQGTPNA